MRRFCEVIAFALVTVSLVVSLVTFLIYTGKAQVVFQFICADYCDPKRLHHGCQMAIARFEILCVWPFGLLDYGSAVLRCKI